MMTIDRDTAIGFAMNIIEQFEGLLEDYGIELPNEDKNENECAANIYGDDYYALEDTILEKIESILKIKIKDDIDEDETATESPEEIDFLLKGECANMIEEYETYTMQNGNILEISYDENCVNPRDYDCNMGIMWCAHHRYILGDSCTFDYGKFESWEEVFNHIVDNYQPLVILPLYLYDHSGITIKTSKFSCNWDSGQIGWIFTTEELLLKLGIQTRNENELIEMLNEEVKEYDLYITGNVFRYAIINKEDHSIIDSCGGFFGTDFEENGLFDDAGFTLQPIQDIATTG